MFLPQEVHRGNILAVAWSPDGTLIASSGSDFTLRLWDVRTGLQRATLEAPLEVGPHIAWSPDCGTIATDDNADVVLLWDARTGLIRGTLEGSADSIDALAWSPDGDVIGVWDGRDTLRLWRTEKSTLWMTLPGQSGQACNFGWSPDGRWMAAGSGGAIKVWDARNGRLRAVLANPRAQGKSVHAMAWSPDGARIAVVGAAPGIALWNVDDERVERTLEAPSDLYEVRWSADGRTLATWSEGEAVFVLDAESGGVLATLGGPTDPVERFEWSPDGANLAWVGMTDTLTVWDARARATRMAFSEPETYSCFGWSPDGRGMVVGEKAGHLQIWDARGGGVRGELEGDTMGCSAVAFSPDGSALAEGSFEGTLRVWDLAGGTARLTFRAQAYWVTSLSWSPDGHVLAATGHRSPARLFDARTGELRAELGGPETCATIVAWSPDGATIVTGGDEGALLFWDAKTFALRTVLEAHPEWPVVSVLSWSPDGRMLASSSSDIVKVWNTREGELVSSLEGHRLEVAGVAWKPDGSLLASAGLEDVVKLWDPKSGTLRATLGAEDNDTQVLAWSPDGASLAATSRPGQLAVWDVRRQRRRLLVELSSIDARNLTWNLDSSVIAAACREGMRLLRVTDGTSLRFARAVPGEEGGFVVHTETGAFEGHETLFDRMSFRLGGDLSGAAIVTARQIVDCFQRPGLFADFMAGRAIEPCPAARVGVGAPPTVEIVGAIPPEIRAESVPLRFRAIDRGGGVSDLRVEVNGAPVETRVVADSVWEADVPLAHGLNEVAAEAFTVAGRVRSLRLSACIVRPSR